MKITKKQKYIAWGSCTLLVSIAIAVPFIVQSTKQSSPSFNLSIIKSQMQIATKHTATLEGTKATIVNMYQNGTSTKLSPQAQKAAHVLAQYIHANKTRKKFAFVLGKDHQDQQLLLLTISNNLVKPQADASLQKGIRQVTTFTQKQEELSLVKQLPWVTKALHQAEFGILFWIYQHRLSSQEALLGTSKVPPLITAINFQRVKTAHEQLQDEAWVKMIAVIQNLTSRQLKIRANDQQLPSQTKIDASHIMLAIQKIITSDNEISKAASKLMKVDNIKVQLVDKTGAIIITIKNYGHDKIITIFGFKAIGTLLDIVQAKINVAKDGASWPTKSNEVAHGQKPRASDVNAPLKDGVTFKFQSATVVNNRGKSTLTYEADAHPQVEGTTPQDVTFVISGFETKDQKDARERIARLAQVAIQKLVATNFTTGINKAQIAWIGKPLKADVIEDIKKQINDRDAKALILPGDITITSNSVAQTITIVILNHGPIKTITISGFSTIEDYSKSHSIKDYLDQVLSAIPPSSGALEIPEGITSTQFDDYVQAMGDSSTIIDGNTMNKFAEQYRAKITSLTIPSSFTTIGTWFQHFNKITSLIIPDSVTTIEASAFNSSPLTTLSLGEALKTIGTSAFKNAQLISLDIPNSVTTIGAYAFFLSPLTTLSLGEKIQTIGASAFSNALLISLDIPNLVTTIGDYAFKSSPLTTLSLGEKIQTIGNGAFKNAQLISLDIPNLVTTIGDYAFNSSPLTTLSLGEKIQTIGNGAFKNAQLISLDIPNLVTTIGDYAFKSSPLTTLSLGEALQTIGVRVFKNAQLISLDIPNSVTTIGRYAFFLSPLTTLSLGNKLQTIGASAFSNALLISLDIPNSVTTIGNYAFKSSPLTTLSLGDQLQTIGARAFYNAQLTSLIIPASVTTIGASTFASAQLTSLRIPNSVTTIGDYAFKSSPLTSLTLGDQLQTIGNAAFASALLTSLIIPDAVTAIGINAFLNSPLTNVKVFEDVTLGTDAFKAAIRVTETTKDD